VTWLRGRSASVIVPAARCGRVVWSGHGGSLRRGGRGFGCSGLRVARWVADRCVRALFCVVRRCSALVFSLVTPHRCWSAEVPGLHGMQEVWGSNPHSSTGKRHNSKTRAEGTAGKYRNGQSPEVPHVYLDRASFWLILLVGPEDPRVMDGSRRAAELGKCSALQSLDSCRTVTPAVLARQFRH
jgi:hypothetical protein